MHFILIARQPFDHITSLDIQVVPTYSRNSFIPDQLAFNLSWEEKGANQTETIITNPRSHQRITASMRNTIAFLREERAKHSEVFEWVSVSLFPFMATRTG